jgi:hypothetical protein
MPRERTFWLILVTLAVAGFAMSLFGNRPRTERLTLGPEAPPLQPQKATARTWRDATFELVSTIPTGEGSRLERPTLLRTDPQGALFVLDSASRRIEKLSVRGEFVETFGSADLRNPSDVAVARSGDVWVCDPEPKQITVFSPGGRIARVIQLDATPVRIILESDGGFVAMLHAAGPKLFRRYSAAGRPLESFGAFFHQSLQSSLTADGWFLGLDSGSFAYPFRRAGLLASYTFDGRLRFFRSTIDPVPLPDIKIDSAGGQRADTKRGLSALSGSTLADEIFLLGSEGGHGARVVDVYGAEEGSYRYSLSPPDPNLRSFALAPGYFYGISPDGLRIWRHSAPPFPNTPPAVSVRLRKEKS